MSAPPPTVLLGSLSPDFDLPCTAHGTPVRRRAALSDYRGSWLVIVFYPRDFSLVCPTELAALSNRIEEFREHGAEILGISTDSVESHERWIATPRNEGGLGGLHFPLASDEDGSVSRAFGVYMPRQRVSLRGLFILDPNGVVQYQVVHNLSVGRRSDDILRVLAALQTGGLCCEGWSPEKPKTIDPTQILSPGRVLSHYRIEETLGSGSFAHVYRARDLTLERSVALKVFKPKAAGWSRGVLDEARAAAALSHPNVATIYAVDDSEGVSVIAMEYVAGKNLAERALDGPASPEWVASIVRQVASALADAHERGIVHGDLKPGNILVTDDDVAKVVDFGLSRRTVESKLDGGDQDATVDEETPGLSGTPGYMSPEQVGGDPASPSSDVFALGVIAFELLTGRKAFTGANILAILREIERSDTAALADETPERFRDLLKRMLARDPADRTIAMAEISRLLAEEDGPHAPRLVESLS
ncbi:MAG: redoxin domain-containing protein [Isosphaeraceae bacterium]|nr:redoxin domain-containing protein [Isosphaeraceae bacterium]